MTGPSRSHHAKPLRRALACLSADKAAVLIGVSHSTTYDLAHDELPTVHLRRRILVPASAVADILGVSLLEVYGALNRLVGDRGTTRPETVHAEITARSVTVAERLRRASALVVLLPASVREPTHGDPRNQPNPPATPWRVPLRETRRAGSHAQSSSR